MEQRSPQAIQAEIDALRLRIRRLRLEGRLAEMRENEAQLMVIAAESCQDTEPGIESGQRQTETL